VKRAWCLLVLENFADAQMDAENALEINENFDNKWLAYEILGHCHAKSCQYEEAEANFTESFKLLRNSSESNQKKAVVTGRVVTVLKIVREQLKTKTRKKSASKSKKTRTEKQKGSDGRSADAKPLPKLHLGPHSVYSNCSSALSVVWREGKGRCVVANRDIDIGSVLIVDPGFAHYVDLEEMWHRCCVCAKRTNAGLPCRSCAVAQY